MTIFPMPSLGADMEAGKLVEWLVKPGDRVAKGDVVAVVETQKGAIEIEIFEAGQIAELIAEVGQTLPVGAPLARLETAEEAAPTGPESPPDTAPPEPSSARVSPVSPTAPPRPARGAPLASPAAKARAAELGLTLDGIFGSGPGGAVLLADVEGAVAAGPPPAPPRAPKAKPGLDMAAMRRAIAAAMSRSKREIPHYYLMHEIDLQAAQDWLTSTNAERAPDRRLLMGALLIRATVQALAKVPELNGQFESDVFAPNPRVHCGVAIALRGGGLIAPAILDAQALTLDGIMDAMRDLVSRTRSGRLRNSEITQGTITVSSLGETGIDALTGVIFPPQVALVGFGTPRFKPVVREGTVQASLCVTATLAADHRVSDGRSGAQFLAEIARLLQEPESQ